MASVTFDVEAGGCATHPVPDRRPRVRRNPARCVTLRYPLRSYVAWKCGSSTSRAHGPEQRCGERGCVFIGKSCSHSVSVTPSSSDSLPEITEIRRTQNAKKSHERLGGRNSFQWLDGFLDRLLYGLIACSLHRQRWCARDFRVTHLTHRDCIFGSAEIYTLQSALGLSFSPVRLTLRNLCQPITSLHALIKDLQIVEMCCASFGRSNSGNSSSSSSSSR